MYNKMTKKIILVFSLAMFLACNSATANNLDRNDQHLLGPVKKVSSSSAANNIAAFTTWSFRKDGSIESLEMKMSSTDDIIFYDQKGRAYRVQKITADGKRIVTTSTVYDDANYTYKIHYQKQGYPEEVSGELDKNGNFIDYYQYDLNGAYQGKTLSTYNEVGLLSEMNYYDNNNNHFLKSTYAYNRDYRVISNITVDKKGNISDKTEYIYDENGRCIETRNYKQAYNTPSELVIFSKTQMLFDISGREIETRDYRYNSLGETKTVFRYSEYDKYGNWLRRTMAIKGANEKEQEVPLVMTRTIEYY